MSALFSEPHLDGSIIASRTVFEGQLVKLLPDLRKFARSLTREVFSADDLVQDTVLRALRAYLQFEVGTNMKAYVFKIMQNCFFNNLRSRRIEPGDSNEENTLWVAPNQDSIMELSDVGRAIDSLVPAHREIISLIRLNGCSYEEAATAMRCRIGTIKSRMSRADAALRAVLDPEVSSRKHSSGLDKRQYRSAIAPHRALESQHAR